MSEPTTTYIACASGNNAQTDCLVMAHGDLVRLVGYSKMDFDPDSVRQLVRAIARQLPPEPVEREPVGRNSGDAVVDAVIERLIARSQTGQLKYGCTLTRQDLSLLDWLRHAEEEGMDQVLYLRRAILELESMQDDGK